MENKYPRYINVLTIIIFDCKFSFKLGNPMWFIQEFKNLKGESDGK